MYRNINLEKKINVRNSSWVLIALNKYINIRLISKVNECKFEKYKYIIAKYRKYRIKHLFDIDSIPLGIYQVNFENNIYLFLPNPRFVLHKAL